MLLFHGCATWETIETIEEASLSIDKDRITAEGPVGWLAFASGKRLFISREGPFAHGVYVEKKTLANAFRRTKAPVTANTLITNMVDYYTAEVKKELEGLKVNVESTEFAKLSGKSGAKAHYSYATSDGLMIDLICYFTVHEGHFYEIVYKTPRLHLLERDQELVEDFIASIEF